MGLYTREQHAYDIRELAIRQAKVNRLLISCVHCGTEFESIEGILSPEIVEEIFRGRAAVCCAGCGNPRESVLSADQHREISKEIERSIRACDGKLVGTALRITETRAMQKGGWFAWVIGASKEHEPGCASKRGDDNSQYCTCDGQWYPTRKNGPLIKYKSRTFRPTSIMEIGQLQARGVTVMPVYPRKSEKAPEEEPEVEEIDLGAVWKKVPIAELPAYEAEGRWLHTPGCNDCAVRWSCALEADGPKYEPCPKHKFWEPRWMIRYMGLRKDAEYFEAMEVWGE